MTETADNPLVDSVRAHAAGCWPGARVEITRWTEGGLLENIVDLGVVRVTPSEEHAAAIYISAGAGAEPMEDGYGVEMFLLAPRDESQAVKLVSMAAHLHADPRYPLSLGQVLEIGQPWLPGSTCQHLLVCLPDAFGPEFEWLSSRERTIRFVWLVPITAREAELARDQGYAALQEKLAAAQVDLGEPGRKSVV